MSAYSDFETSKLRQAVLTVLSGAPGFELNFSVLFAGIADLGFRVSHDKFLVEMVWLEEQGLISTRELLFVRFACVTQRGLDVANGTAHVPGVHRR